MVVVSALLRMRAVFLVMIVSKRKSQKKKKKLPHQVICL